MSGKIAFALALSLVAAGATAAPFSLVREESRIDFVVKEMGVPVSGTFRQFDADVDFDPARPDQSSADVRVDVGSLTTGNDAADALAVGPDWLDAARAARAEFRSTSMRALGADRYEARGTLRIRNRSRDVVVQFTRSEHPGGRIVLAGGFTVHRNEFGVGAGEWNQGGIVADEVPVTLRLTLAPTAPKPTATGSR